MVRRIHSRASAEATAEIEVERFFVSPEHGECVEFVSVTVEGEVDGESAAVVGRVYVERPGQPWVLTEDEMEQARAALDAREAA